MSLWSILPLSVSPEQKAAIKDVNTFSFRITLSLGFSRSLHSSVGIACHLKFLCPHGLELYSLFEINCQLAYVYFFQVGVVNVKVPHPCFPSKLKVWKPSWGRTWKQFCIRIINKWHCQKLSNSWSSIPPLLISVMPWRSLKITIFFIYFPLGWRHLYIDGPAPKHTIDIHCIINWAINSLLW